MSLRSRSARTTIDRRVYAWISGLPHTGVVDQQVSLLSDLGRGLGWGLGGAWLVVRGGRRGRLAAATSIGAMLLAVAVVQGPIKGLLRRRRPFVRIAARVVGRQPLDPSFPSGHTAGSFAAAMALGHFYPRARPFLFLLASLVGASRVYLGHHFPSDVLVGAALGRAIGVEAGRAARIVERLETKT
jgi:undecaprenyl-diphosphatase